VLVVFAVVLTGLQYAGLAPRVSGQGTEVVAGQVDGVLPVTDPGSSLWEGATAVDVPLSAQILVKPNRSAASVPSLEVRALHNATSLAWRITWADATKDNRTTSQNDFRDAVAVQIAPAAGVPNICMGAAGAQLQILQWKADWQADIDGGFFSVEDEFPHFWSDYYPYLIGEGPYRRPENFTAAAKQYLVGWQVGNPMSEPLKVTPVEDAVAQGFSTITTQANQSALGRGVWASGTWSVVIARAKSPQDAQDVPIGDNVLAFAVWDGASGDVGSRKSASSWVTLRLETPTGPPPLYLVLGLGGLVVAIALIALVPLARRRRRRAQGATAEVPKPAPAATKPKPGGGKRK